jgi:hypothetical protein
MAWHFIKNLFKSIFASLNGITTWIGIISFYLLWLLPKSNVGDKVNITIATISLSSRLLILLGFIFISILLTFYSTYKKQQRKIDELGGIKDTKQEIRNFLESINPKILEMVNNGQKEILLSINIPNEVELIRLSKLPDFDKFLLFEKYGFGDYMLNCTPFVGYRLYPKDALIK